MTREEAIEHGKEQLEVFGGEHREFIKMAIKALEQEPITKNDLGVVPDLVSTITEKISEQVTESHEEFIFETIRPYCENVVQMKISKRDLEQALLKYYGKNDLGVDCISREQALNEFCIYNSYDSIGVDKVRSYLKALPSVTPQEPILDKLKAEITTLQHRCYALTKGTMCAFCKYECEYKVKK